jgi:hypothetical protein
LETGTDLDRMEAWIKHLPRWYLQKSTILPWILDFWYNSLQFANDLLNCLDVWAKEESVVHRGDEDNYLSIVHAWVKLGRLEVGLLKTFWRW